MVLDVGGDSVELLPERAVWWPAGSALLVADLHWGKSETFRTLGLPVPGGDLEDDLARIAAILSRTGAKRLVVLGDLVHARAGITPELVSVVAAWRRAHPVSMRLVRGNHDRHVPSLPAEWGIEAVPGVSRDGGYAFCHHPVEVPDAYVWCGHIHPVFTLRGVADRIRVPCFHLRPRLGVLPAFGTFTGGAAVRRSEGDVYAVVGSAVVPVPGR
jgi:DNA ligase-associated metallophosphoesterase